MFQTFSEIKNVVDRFRSVAERFERHTSKTCTSADLKCFVSVSEYEYRLNIWFEDITDPQVILFRKYWNLYDYVSVRISSHLPLSGSTGYIQLQPSELCDKQCNATWDRQIKPVYIITDSTTDEWFFQASLMNEFLFSLQEYKDMIQYSKNLDRQIIYYFNTLEVSCKDYYSQVMECLSTIEEQIEDEAI